jgi:hypothetical protein
LHPLHFTEASIVLVALQKVFSLEGVVGSDGLDLKSYLLVTNNKYLILSMGDR